MAKATSGVDYPEGVTIGIERLTMDEIQEILKVRQGLKQRSPRSSRITWLAGMMPKLWRFTGESIVLNKSGGCIDGQHRLHAALKANAPLVAVVVRGVPDNDAKGQGAAWTLADHLGRRGKANAAELAAATRWLYLWNLKKMLSSPSAEGFSNEVGVELEKRTPGLGRSAGWLESERNDSGVLRLAIPSALVFAHYILHEHDHDVAKKFFDALIGDGKRIPRPVTLLRNAIMDSRSGQRRKRLSALETIVYTVKAYRAMREDEPLNSLIWKRVGARIEPFPPLETGGESHGPALANRSGVSPDVRDVKLREMGYLPVAEAGVRLHCTAKHLIGLAKDGKLSFRRVGSNHSYWIYVEDAERVLKRQEDDRQSERESA